MLIFSSYLLTVYLSFLSLFAAALIVSTPFEAAENRLLA